MKHKLNHAIALYPNSIIPCTLYSLQIRLKSF